MVFPRAAVVAILFSFFLCLLSRNVTKYLSEDIGLAIKRISRHFFPFPAISFCGEVNRNEVEGMGRSSQEKGWVVWVEQTFKRENDVP